MHPGIGQCASLAISISRRHINEHITSDSCNYIGQILLIPSVCGACTFCQLHSRASPPFAQQSWPCLFAYCKMLNVYLDVTCKHAHTIEPLCPQCVCVHYCNRFNSITCTQFIHVYQCQGCCCWLLPIREPALLSHTALQRQYMILTVHNGKLTYHCSNANISQWTGVNVSVANWIEVQTNGTHTNLTSLNWDISPGHAGPHTEAHLPQCHQTVGDMERCAKGAARIQSPCTHSHTHTLDYCETCPCVELTRCRACCVGMTLNQVPYVCTQQMISQFADVSYICGLHYILHFQSVHNVRPHYQIRPLCVLFAREITNENLIFNPLHVASVCACSYTSALCPLS